MSQLISFDKVIIAELIWFNQYNNLFRQTKPTIPSVNGYLIKDEYALQHHSYPKETSLERASRLDILDIWTPRLKIKMNSRITLTFEGSKALKLWDSYRAYKFSSKKKKEARPLFSAKITKQPELI